MTNSSLFNMAHRKFVDLPTKTGDFLQLCKRLLEGNPVFFGSHCIPVEYSKEGHGAINQGAKRRSAGSVCRPSPQSCLGINHQADVSDWLVSNLLDI